jgi:competence protein ComEA
MFSTPMLKSFRFVVAAALLLTAVPVFTQAADPKPAAATPAAGDKIDINTATIDQLKAFPGIGDTYAKRIVDGRPYANKGQLISKKILPAGVYNKIKEQIIATQAKP